MNAPCKRVHLLERDPDHNPDCDPDSDLDNFCSVYWLGSPAPVPMVTVYVFLEVN